MNRKLIAVGIIVIIAVSSNTFFSGCTEEPKPRGEEPILVLNDSNATQEGINSVLSANNQFALDFYYELKDEVYNIDREIPRWYAKR